MEPTGNQASALVHDAGWVRLKRCKYGLMAYMPHDQYIGRSLDLYGEFSPGEAAFFSQVLKPGMTALDVGANAGAHSVLFALKVGPTGRVHAFEPQRAIFRLMCSNLTINGHMHAIPHHAAAGAEQGSLKVPPIDYSKSNNFGSLSLGSWEMGEEVPIMTIDQLSLPQCHLIKADVEGMELSVLQGAAETIQRCRPVLYVENDRTDKSPGLISFMLEANYRVYWHITPYYKPDNFFGNTDNVFQGTVSVNLLAFHREANVVLQGGQEITSPDATWK